MMKTEDSEAMSSHLLDYLRRHPSTKKKKAALVFDYPAYSFSEDPKMLPEIV